MLKNEKGFTLIEIIAVLVILGILAAVAIPRYIDMMNQSRISAAQTGIAEVKARASGYYAQLTLSGAGTPTVAAVFASVNSNFTLGSDFSASLGTDTSGNISISITSVKSQTVSPSVTGTWFWPAP